MTLPFDFISSSYDACLKYPVIVLVCIGKLGHHADFYGFLQNQLCCIYMYMVTYRFMTNKLVMTFNCCNKRSVYLSIIQINE